MLVSHAAPHFQLEKTYRLFCLISIYLLVTFGFVKGFRFYSVGIPPSYKILSLRANFQSLICIVHFIEKVPRDDDGERPTRGLLSGRYQRMRGRVTQRHSLLSG